MRKSARNLLSFLFALAVASTPALSAERSFTVNALDQVVEVADSGNPALNATFTYDENGNRQTKAQGGVTTTYRWDVRDRLIQVLRDDELLARYDYDDSGLRIEKTVRGSPNSTLTRFQYDEESRIRSETNVLNNTLVRYYRAADGTLLAFWRNGVYRSVISDAKGTPIAILSLDGAVLGRFTYDPWGGLLRSVGTESAPIRYTGYYYDEETGLYYARARYYDPAIGAFISRDPIDGDVERPITQNKYIAFNANPGVYQDPTGHCGYATGDTSECINNVAAAEGWSAERWQSELEIQAEAEERSRPDKILGIAATVSGLGVARAIGAGVRAYRQFRHLGYAAAVAANQGAPHVEQALEIASGTPGPGASTVPSVVPAASRSARVAGAMDELSDVPRPPVPARVVDNAPISTSNADAMVVVEGSSGTNLLAPSRPSSAMAAAGRALADSDMDALRGAGLSDREISRHLELTGDISIFRGTSAGWPGNPSVQALGVTPVSLDPAVGTIYALESRVHGGQPILLYGRRAAFGQDLNLGNIDPMRRRLEREVSMGVDPSTFERLAPRSIDADSAREVLIGMGYNIPSSVRDTNHALELLSTLPKMTPEQIQTFVNRVDKR